MSGPALRPPEGPPRLFLIDGYALIYRAFFALITRPLRTSKGENTSVAWGIANFLLRLREQHRPEFLAWVNDAGDSFRTERYPEYKSTREKLDAELQADFDRSVERVSELLTAFRVPLVSVDGYEADDVIATLADRGADRGWQVVIVSGDKDFYQLIRPRVALLNPGRGGPAAVEEQWVDETNASERLGVPPSQVIDYLSLVGDSADNVPGVKGIGEKGAVQLLTEFGSLDRILEHAAEIPGKRAREALLAGADSARLSRELVTIMRNVPFDLDMTTLVEGVPDKAALVKLFAELEFHSLARKMSEGTAAAPEAPLGEGSAAAPADTAAPAALAPPPFAVKVLDDPAELPDLVARLRQSPLVSLDTETSSLEPHDAELIGLGLSIGLDETWYLPFGHRPPDGALAAPAPVRNLPAFDSAALAALREVLADPAVPKAGHNIKYDWQVLRRAGVELGGLAYDSMLASFVVDPGRRSHGIDTLSLEHLGRTMRSFTDLTGKGKAQIPFAEVPVSEAAAYCGADAATVLALRDVFAPTVKGHALEPLLQTIELPLVRVLVDMEWAGVAIDRARFAELAVELAGDLARLEREIAELAGSELNLNSPKQLAVLLFEKLQLPVQRRTKTGPSTDAEVLELLADMGHEVPRRIMEYRELQKLKSTYVDVLPLSINRTTGRIHTSYNQTGAATGRLSSNDPNLQNIPIRTRRGEEIRRGFVPAPGCKFVVADYSQIELRLMAHLSGDAAFVKAFKEGGDIHRQTASIIFNVPLDQVTGEMRSRAKTINFGTIYGQGAFSLAKMLGISQEDARNFIAQYFERFSGVRAYLDRQVELARERGYVETLFGRRRYIPEIRDKNFNQRAFGERLAGNSPLQGSAADLIKIAMRRLHDALAGAGLKARLLLQVHDELVVEAPEAEVARVVPMIREAMEGAVTLNVPLVVDVGVGPNWLDAKKG
ncbi:MAG TPA: DNA polymerase I [Gemmatimonadales bacterium]|nr:DNA polymerase I [Gemmatimonadales bacterium]